MRRAATAATLRSLQRGPAALDNPAHLARLRHCDAAAMRLITARLASWRGLALPWLWPWREAEIDALMARWNDIRGSR